MTAELLECATKEEAALAIREIEISLGYPRPGVNIGQGHHAPAHLALTTSAAVPVEGKSGTYAIPLTPETKSVLSAKRTLQIRQGSIVDYRKIAPTFETALVVAEAEEVVK